MFFLYSVFTLAEAFWISILYDCLKKEKESVAKVTWTMVIMFGNVLGAVLYLAIRVHVRETEELRRRVRDQKRQFPQDYNNPKSSG